MIGEAHFDIWFARERGWLSLLQAPANSFGWVGRGTLRVEPHGLRFRAARSRVLQFLRVDHFIAGAQVAEVYREGCAIRVQLRSPDPATPFVSFWASDTASAANIVGLMPTAVTVELDEAVTSSRKPRRSSRAWLAGAALLVALTSAAAWITSQRRSEPAPVPAVAAPAPVVAPSQAEPRTSPLEVDLIALDIERFLVRKEALSWRYMQALEALQLDRMRAEMFVMELENALSPQWQALEEELREQPLRRGSARSHVRGLLVEITENWQEALRAHAHGLREQDSEVVRRAFEVHLRNAVQAESSAKTVRDALQEAIRPPEPAPSN